MGGPFLKCATALILRLSGIVPRRGQVLVNLVAPLVQRQGQVALLRRDLDADAQWGVPGIILAEVEFADDLGVGV